MPESRQPTQLATVHMDVLRDEQWAIAVLLLQALSRPLTIQEVQAEVGALRAVIASAKITWE